MDGFFDTVEVCGSSPHGPTISFNKLASVTSLGKAPNGSIKEVVGDSQGLHVCGRRQMRRTRLPREQTLSLTLVRKPTAERQSRNGSVTQNVEHRQD
jgi:hypothetical protein